MAESKKKPKDAKKLKINETRNFFIEDYKNVINYGNYTYPIILYVEISEKEKDQNLTDDVENLLEVEKNGSISYINHIK